MFWDPFDEIAKMHEEINSLFDRIYRNPGNQLEDKRNMRELSKMGEGFRAPFADIRETETGIIASIELPGADKKDIELNVTDNSIEVKAEQKQEKKTEKEGVSSYTSRFTRFYRSIPLSAEVDSDKAKARYHNGILSIEIPKLKVLECKTKKIDIE